MYATSNANYLPEWQSLAHLEHNIVTDKDICKQLISVFDAELALLKVRGVHFFVKNRVVTLQGVVRNQSEKRNILELVQTIPNVSGIIDSLSY